MKVDTCDVVVVGFGNAAQAAAYSAHCTGAKVIVLEKAPEHKRGGNTWFSSGAQFRHVHNGLPSEMPLLPHVPEKEFARIDLPPYTGDDFYADMMRVTRGRSDPSLAELLVNESYPTVKWMTDAGIQWEIMYLGGIPENGRLRWHHGHSFIHSKEGGAGLVRMWHEILKKKGVDVRFSTGAQRLVTGGSGEVTGLICQTPTEVYQIKCKSVVLACGGFEANPSMRAQYLGAGWDLGKVRGTKYNTGEGIQMALDIGAQAAGHWTGSHATPIDAAAGEYEAGFLDPANLRNRTHRYAWRLGIMVNAEGRRFVNEGEDFHAYTYAKMGAEILKQPGSTAYQIFDAKVIEGVERHRYDGAVPTVANSVRELAELLEITPNALEETISGFNDSIMTEVPFNESVRDGRGTKGISPPKTNWAQLIDKPPFTAYAATCGLTFTYGGLKIDNRCQVINQMEQPIRGLFAAGELTGGFFYYNYPAGAGMTRGAVTGRIAGGNAAA